MAIKQKNCFIIDGNNIMGITCYSEGLELRVQICVINAKAE
ncbi:hypothetical protein SynBIOSE41_02366 [Synechococcus sp. BIOS-E4-1]|nr:hypothetical protein SynBIOSE41_02366 [Synechococcus sp. BIOS-E4-1]